MTEHEKPQVYVSVSGGIADVMVTKGSPEDVDVIEIDWDNVTGDSWNGDENWLNEVDDAVEASLRLPTQSALGNLRDIEQHLDTFLDPVSGYVEKDAFRKRAIGVLKDIRAKITDLEMNNG